VAWLFNDATVWNTGTQVLPAGTYPGSVPSQGTAATYDAINVVGLRLTFTARSAGEVFWESNRRYRRPAARTTSPRSPPTSSSTTRRRTWSWSATAACSGKGGVP